MDKETAFQNVKLVEVANEFWNWVIENENAPIYGIKFWHANDTWYGKVFYQDTPLPENEQLDDYDM